MTRKWYRKMILSSILLVLIFIRHTVICTYKNDYKPRWSGINQNHQHALTAHQALQSLHRQHRHHHDDNMRKNNREMHIKSKHTETIDGTMVQVKHRSVNNSRSYVLPIRVGMSNYDVPMSTFKSEQNPRSLWSHNNRQSHQENLQHKEHSSQFQRNLFEKTSKIDSVDPDKISHEDHGFKSKAEYDEDYDENDYYEEVDENENKIEERQENTAEAEDEINDDFFDESDSRKDEVKSEEEAENRFRDENGRQDEDNYSEEYVNDESYSSNDDQNHTMSLTDIKWKHYGTPDAVKLKRQQFLTPSNLANEHIERIKEEVNCRWPHPKVIQVREASNRFIPHCTVLHRCADDTGCCLNDTKTCVAKSSTSVELYFYITSHLGNKTKTSIGHRTFDNHTECHCVDRSRFRRAPRHTSFSIVSNLANLNQSCRCPSHFRVVQERAQCRCECLSWNQKCYDLKGGKDQFAYKDQKCISENKCQKPSCEYGHYNKHSGRCPKQITLSSRKNYR